MGRYAPVGRYAPPAERFWRKVDKNGPTGFHFKTGADLGPCWLWTGALSDTGYGSFNKGSHRVNAHRYSFELVVGPVPDGLTLDHLCRRLCCVNPGHLDPVTMRVNILRGGSPSARQARQEVCKRDHPLDGPEADIYRDRRGSRQCRRCRRIRRAEGAA